MTAQTFTFRWGYTWDMSNTYSCQAASKEEAVANLLKYNKLGADDFYKLINIF